MCATHGAAYLDRYGNDIPQPHRRVLQLLADCGTGRLGSASYRCAQCDAVHHTNASCGNRHCPNCQTSKNGDWCVEQTQKLLPCDYFLVTFTLPCELRSFVRSHQHVCYRAMFDAAAFALKRVLANPKFCGADITGFTSVLHTFGRDLTYHPHVHVIVPGGGLTQDGTWKSALPGFLAPVKLLSQLFRMELERLVTLRIDAEERPRPGVFRREFVSDVESVGDGTATLKYLSRYVFRTAITNDRIVSLQNGQVTFRYRKTGEQRERLMTLPVFEFLRRFLQHVLPKGLHKVRHYGFLSRRTSRDLDEVRAVILESLEDEEPDLELEAGSVPALRRFVDHGPICPDCGGPLVFERFHRIRPPPLEWCGRITEGIARSF